MLLVPVALGDKMVTAEMVGKVVSSELVEKTMIAVMVVGMVAAIGSLVAAIPAIGLMMFLVGIADHSCSAVARPSAGAWLQWHLVCPVQSVSLFIRLQLLKLSCTQ